MVTSMTLLSHVMVTSQATDDCQAVFDVIHQIVISAIDPSLRHTSMLLGR